jgi:hypothetical protein
MRDTLLSALSPTHDLFSIIALLLRWSMASRDDVDDDMI